MCIIFIPKILKLNNMRFFIHFATFIKKNVHRKVKLIFNEGLKLVILLWFIPRINTVDA